MRRAPTTRPGNRFSVELSWYLEGFEPGMQNEYRTFIRRLDEEPNDAMVFGITNAGGPGANGRSCNVVKRNCKV